MITIIHYIALQGTILSALLLLPMIHGFASGETQDALLLFLYAILGGFIFFSALLSVRGRARGFTRVTKIYLVLISWILFPLLLAVPFSNLFNISYGDAVFEAFSAFTTTSADSLQNIEAASQAALWLRVQTQWLGGLATLVTFTSFLGAIGVGGLPYRYAGALENTADGMPSLGKFSRMLFQLYIVFTIAAFVVFMLCGLSPIQSLTLASSAVSSGAYIPADISSIDVLGGPVMLVFAFFLILAGTSVFWHKSLFSLDFAKLKEHRESYVLIVLCVVFAFLFFYVISSVSGPNQGFAFIAPEAIFNAVSIITTSGLESRPGIFALLSPLLIVFVIFFGAGCYSTGGGIKLFRLGAMLSHTSSEISQLVYPNGVNNSRFVKKRYTKFVMKTIWVMFFASVAVIAVSALALSLTGFSFQAALTVSVAAFSNAGPIYSPEWAARGAEGWPAYADMLLNQKYIISCVMLIGKLEVIAVIASLNVAFWYRR